MIIHGFYPLIGGAENVAHDVAKNLVKAGHRVKVFTSDLQRFKKKEVIDGIEIQRIVTLKREMKAFTPLEMIIFIFMGLLTIVRSIKEYKPDIIHAHFSIPGGLLAYIAKKFTKTPYIVYFHGADINIYGTKSYSKFYNMTKPVFKTICKNADLLLTYSNGFKKMIHSIAPSLRVEVVPGAIDLKKFFPIKKLSSANKVIILMVGRLIPLKGFQYVIYALPKVINSTDEEINVNIIGDGSYKDELKKIAKTEDVLQYINFVGWKNYNELLKFYQRADIFILPSLSEAFGMVLLEAMAVGLPIIGTSVGGIPELVLDHKNGLIIPPANVHAIANAIISLIKNDMLREQMRRNGLEMVKNFSWDKIIEQYIGFYKEVLKENLNIYTP